VTGPTAGSIGAAVLLALAKGEPAALIIAGRTPSKFQTVIDEIARDYPAVKVVTVVLDLSSQESVRTAARQIMENDEIPRIDVLINNAGPSASLPRESAELTPKDRNHGSTIWHDEGWNRKSVWCQPHWVRGVCLYRPTLAHARSLFSHFLFTNLLLPKLRLTINAQPTVVNTSSAGHRMFPGNFDDANWQKRGYNIWVAYGSGKAANIVFSKALEKRGIRSVALHPGCMCNVVSISTPLSQSSTCICSRNQPRGSPGNRTLTCVHHTHHASSDVREVGGWVHSAPENHRGSLEHGSRRCP